MSDRRVREQIGGSQSNNYSLSDLKGAFIGQYSALTGGWNAQPTNNGYVYKGYDTNAGLSDGASITFADYSDVSPPVKAVKLMGLAPGSAPLPNDKTIEVRFCGYCGVPGSYRFEFERRGFTNGFYNNSSWAVAIAGSSSGFLQGSTNLEYYSEGNLINDGGSSAWRPYSASVTISGARPYVTMLLYMYHRSGGSPSDPPEGIEYRKARLIKV
jgi:hypothetical protein